MNDKNSENAKTQPQETELSWNNQELSQLKICWILFYEFVAITSLVLGGGYAIIAAAEKVFVDKYHVLSEDEIPDMMAVVQSVPGILACNCAIYIGKRAGGWPGAMAALAGSVLPSLIIIMLLAAGASFLPLDHPYVRGAFIGLISAIVAMVLVALWKLAVKVMKNNYFGVIVALGCFLGMFFWHISPAYLIVVAVGLGIGQQAILKYRRKGR